MEACKLKIRPYDVGGCNSALEGVVAAFAQGLSFTGHRELRAGCAVENKGGTDEVILSPAPAYVRIS